MAPRRIVFHPEAALEIEEARCWYSERSLGAERGFLDEVREAVRLVLESPLRWPRHKANTRRYVFKRYPYSFVFRVYPDLVRVLAVPHDKRRPIYWLDRADEA